MAASGDSKKKNRKYLKEESLLKYCSFKKNYSSFKFLYDFFDKILTPGKSQTP